jgi:hypothetical protein
MVVTSILLVIYLQNTVPDIFDQLSVICGFCFEISLYNWRKNEGPSLEKRKDLMECEDLPNPVSFMISIMTADQVNSMYFIL